VKKTALALTVAILAVLGGLMVRADLERPKPTEAQPSVAATVTTTAIPTAASPVALAVPRDLPADWRLRVEHRVLFALPPEWGTTSVPGGETGRWEILMASGPEREDVMTVALWSGRTLADVAGSVTEGHSVRVPPTRRELSLEGRPRARSRSPRSRSRPRVLAERSRTNLDICSSVSMAAWWPTFVFAPASGSMRRPR